jgi:hypothetical protein
MRRTRARWWFIFLHIFFFFPSIPFRLKNDLKTNPLQTLGKKILWEEIKIGDKNHTRSSLWPHSIFQIGRPRKFVWKAAGERSYVSARLSSLLFYIYVFRSIRVSQLCKIVAIRAENCTPIQVCCPERKFKNSNSNINRSANINKQKYTFKWISWKPLSFIFLSWPCIANPR